jgi:hypothetical protein
MPGLSRREAEERQQAVLDYFLKNPRATGDEAQCELMNGRLTGRKGPKMGIAMVFRLKRQAEDLLRRGTAMVSATPATALSPEQAAPVLASLRELTAKVQTLLDKLPDVAEVRITRGDAKAIRQVTREDDL